MNKTEKYNYLRTVLLKQQAPFTQKGTGSARARGNLRNHNKRHGRARAREAGLSTRSQSRLRACAHCKFTVENQDLWGRMWGRLFNHTNKILF
jgi:hypothetical protein